MPCARSTATSSSTTGSGGAYATNLNTTAVDPLSFGAAEGKPDALTRPIPGPHAFVEGPVSIEVWTNQRAHAIPICTVCRDSARNLQTVLRRRP